MRRRRSNFNLKSWEDWLDEESARYPWLSELRMLLEEKKVEIEKMVNEVEYCKPDDQEDLERNTLERLSLKAFKLLCENQEVLKPLNLDQMKEGQKLIVLNIRRRQIEVMQEKFAKRKMRDEVLDIIINDNYLLSKIFNSAVNNLNILDNIESYKGAREINRLFEAYLSDGLTKVDELIRGLSYVSPEICAFRDLSVTEMRIVTFIVLTSSLIERFEIEEYSRHTDAPQDEDDIKLYLISTCKPGDISKCLEMSSDLVRGEFLRPIFSKTSNVSYTFGRKLEELVWDKYSSSRNDFNSDFSEEISVNDISLNQMILPSALKKYVEALLMSYEKKSELDIKVANSLLFCFQGKPGTGKTMLAKAIANYLGYKLIRIKGHKASPEFVQFLLRRSEGERVVILFDECDELLGRNPFVGKNDAWAKILFEEYKGILVFTSNYRLSEALLRRMTFVYNFENQSAEDKVAILNLEIEKYTKEIGFNGELPVFNSEDLGGENESINLNGGYFKQAIQLSLASSISEEGKVRVSKDQVMSAIGFLNEQVYFEPKDKLAKANISLQDVILNQDVKSKISMFVEYARENMKTKDALAPAATLLLSGPSGTGKTLLAEGIANSLGREFVSTSGSSFLGPYVGQTEIQIKKTFLTASEKNQVLFIDEVEALFRSRDKATASWQISQVNEFLIQIEKFKGVLIVATNLIEELDFAFSRRFLFQVKVDLPDISTRFKLWKKYSEGFQLSEDDLRVLAEKYILSGSGIRSICYRVRAFGERTIGNIENECALELQSRKPMEKVISLK